MHSLMYISNQHGIGRLYFSITSLFNVGHHRWNMEVDLQSLFVLHVTWCAQLYSLAETRQPPPIPPHWTRIRGRYWSADRRHLFVTPWWARHRCIWRYTVQQTTDQKCNMLNHVFCTGLVRTMKMRNAWQKQSTKWDTTGRILCTFFLEKILAITNEFFQSITLIIFILWKRHWKMSAKEEQCTKIFYFRVSACIGIPQFM